MAVDFRASGHSQQKLHPKNCAAAAAAGLPLVTAPAAAGLRRMQISNIRDVASENYFYDVDLKEMLSESEIEELKDGGLPWRDDLIQYFERAFDETVEQPFSVLLRNTIEKANSATPWHLNNCFFISSEKKLEFSGYLAFQFLRTKRARNNLMETSSCLRQVLSDMGASQKTIEEYSLSSKGAKYIHLNMLLNTDQLNEVANLFKDLIWILGVNRSQTKLFTSDNPIGTRAHLHHPLMPLNGLASKGVEAFYPLSPSLVLIMLDGTYHTHWVPFDRYYIEITDSKRIDSYNSILALQSERFVFSSDGSFSTIEKLKQEDPVIFKRGHSLMRWGRKTYYPNQESSTDD